MTQLLEQAFAAAAKLPTAEQDLVGAFMLAELESERKWTESFAVSQDKLANMADEALREFKAGETRSLNLDRDLPHH
jgi:hypothetical protein